MVEASIYDIKNSKANWLVIAKMSFWTCLAAIAFPLINFVDLAIIGRFDNIELFSGITIGITIIGLIEMCLMPFAYSILSKVAFYFGKRDIKKLQTFLYFGFILSCAYLLFVFICFPFILLFAKEFYSASEQALVAMIDFLKLRIWALPIGAFGHIVFHWIIGMQQIKLAMILSMVADFSNMALSYFLAVTLDMGWHGVVYGTIIGYIIYAFFAFIVAVFLVSKLAQGEVPMALAIRDWNKLKFAPFVDLIFSGLTRIKNNLEDFLDLLKMIFNLGVRTACFVLFLSFFSYSVAKLGDVGISSHGIMVELAMLLSFFLDGIALTANQLTAQSRGKKDEVMFWDVIQKCSVVIFIVAVLSAIAIFVFRVSFVEFFTVNKVIQASTLEVIYSVSFIPITGLLAYLFDGVFLGMQWSGVMRNTLLISVACFIVLVSLIGTQYGIEGLWFCNHVFLLLRGFMMLAVLKKLVARAFS